MVSLTTHFFKKWWYKLLKCVSPPLVGAVLVLCIGINSFAAPAAITPKEIDLLDSRGNIYNLAVGYNKEYVLLPTSIDIIDVSSGSLLGDLKVTPDVSGGTKLGFSFNGAQGTLNYPAYNISGANVSFSKKYDLVLHYDYDFSFSLRFPDVYDCHALSLAFKANMQFSYKPFSAGSISPTAIPAENLFLDNFVNVGGWFSAGDFNIFGSNSDPFTWSFKYSRALNDVSSLNVNDFKCYVYHYMDYNAVDGSLSYNLLDSQVLDEIKDNTGQIAQQQQDYHDQDKNDATNAGSEMQGMATDLETVKSKWEILWYPIEFTNRVMGAFQGSSSRQYQAVYSNVSGYQYNDDLGILEPVYMDARSRAAPRANSGTVIHIPAYTMPVLNVQVWEGADYDLAELKSQFSDAFNLLYVVVTVLEVMWFVGFLRDKYEEVFG